jgi:hypothetical protein
MACHVEGSRLERNMGNAMLRLVLAILFAACGACGDFWDEIVTP